MNRNEEFIERVKKIHNNKYDYSKTIYFAEKYDITVICPIHGEFEIIAKEHLRGLGCKECDGKKNRKKIIREYDWIKPVYPITITPSFDILKSKYKEETDIFIKNAIKVHDNKYDYSKSVVINNIPVTIICPIHGDFSKTTPNSHLDGRGCPECGKIKASDISKSRTISNDEFIKRSKEIHDDKYDYSKTKYTNTRCKVIIICKKHGEFIQRASSHLTERHGCPICKESQGEKIVTYLLNQYNIEFLPQKSFEDLKHRRTLYFDFYLPKINVCIEYDGLQHFKHVIYFGADENLFIELQYRDKLKSEYCEKNNISLLRLTYKDNTEKKIKSKILDFLQIKESNIITKFFNF